MAELENVEVTPGSFRRMTRAQADRWRQQNPRKVEAVEMAKARKSPPRDKARDAPSSTSSESDTPTDG